MGLNNIRAPRKIIYETIVAFLHAEAERVEREWLNLQKEGVIGEEREKNAGDLNQAAHLINDVKVKLSGGYYGKTMWGEEKIRLG